MGRTTALALFFIAGCGPEIGELEQASTVECPPATVEGVDVYQGDNPINWMTVKNEGRVFAFSKASQGDTVTESNFATNWAQLKSVGMARGAYHYFDATVDGTKQAQWFLQQLAAAGGLQPGDLPPALDIECPTSTVQSSSGNYCLNGPTGKNGWAPTATIISEAWAWLDAVEAATGMKPVIYSYVSWFATFGFTDPKLAAYPLWIASPVTKTMPCATVPSPWTQAAFWQWQTTMPLGGIGTGGAAVDEDRFMGTADQLKAFVAADVRDAGSDGPPPASDGGAHDAATFDLATTAPADLSYVEGGRSDGAPKGHGDSGCGCQLGGAPTPRALPLLFCVVALVLVRRRRA